MSRKKMATAKTFNGDTVKFYSDGSVYGRFNGLHNGPVCPANLERRIAALWLIKGELGIIESSEVRDAVRCAERAIEKAPPSMPPLVYFRKSFYEGLQYRPIDRKGAVWSWT